MFYTSPSNTDLLLVPSNLPLSHHRRTTVQSTPTTTLSSLSHHLPRGSTTQQSVSPLQSASASPGPQQRRTAVTVRRGANFQEAHHFTHRLPRRKCLSVMLLSGTLKKGCRTQPYRHSGTKFVRVGDINRLGLGQSRIITKHTAAHSTYTHGLTAHHLSCAFTHYAR